jgi:outer membrane protein assembly factor BamD
MFINTYPDSERLAEANNHYRELQFKLETKAFEIGKTYYKTAQTDFRNYKSAIVVFDNLINDFLGTRLKEEALYFRFKAFHDLVIVSTERKKPNRIKDAIAAYEKLVRNFPESKFLKDSDKLLLEIKNEEKQLVKS